MMDFSLPRRTILQGIGAVAVAGSSAAGAAPAPGPKTYALVGCGSRARMFQNAIWGPYKGDAKLVAICDTNPGRMAYVRHRAAEQGAEPPASFAASDFNAMIHAHKPDAVIVATTDSTHADYMVRALDLGCDVITEKPMTTEASMAQAIIDAAARTGRSVRVTFNYRYAPFRTQIKELLMQGLVGDVLSVDFNWLLNTVHGADYFRRWHSDKRISGGLMVHKSTHHFDLVNWWLSDMPKTVTAIGKRDFYTPAMARRFGLKGPHERCRTCPEKTDCTFHLDLTKDPGLNALYIENEEFDGYFRDRCVFREDISIEDTMNVFVKYEGGATLNYSLNAFAAWEGYNIAFNGTKGRLEHSVVEFATTAGASALQSSSEQVTTRFVPLRGEAVEIAPAIGEGDHGGGDAIMLDYLFSRTPAADPLLRTADERAGAASILVGVAANQCFATGRPVTIDSLVKGLRKPDMPAMPDRNEPLPMPQPA